MRGDWQVIATRTIRRFPWLRREAESLILYDDVTEHQARTLVSMLTRQDMGVTYAARQKGQCDDVHAE